MSHSLTHVPERQAQRGLVSVDWPAGAPEPASLRRSPRALPRSTRTMPLSALRAGHPTIVPHGDDLDAPVNHAPRRIAQPGGARPMPLGGFTGTIVPPEELMEAGSVTYDSDDEAWFGADSLLPAPSRMATPLGSPGLQIDPAARTSSILYQEPEATVWIVLTAVVLVAMVAGVGAFAGTLFLFIGA